MARIPARQHPGRWERFWLWLIHRMFGRQLTPYGIVAHVPRMLPGMLIMNGLFGVGDWHIGPELRTLIHLRVAELIGCVF
jgi:hypothetical protein